MPQRCTDYFCPTNGSCIKRPIQAHVISPFVRMLFPPVKAPLEGKSSNGNSYYFDSSAKPDLTVGNNSNAPNNHAAIKSFSFGSSDGSGAEIEIFDEQGGEFDMFVGKLVKELKQAQNYTCIIEWGWILSDCDDIGIPYTDPNGNPSRRFTLSSAKHFFSIQKVILRIAANGVLIRLQLANAMEFLSDVRSNEVLKDLTLKQAITTFLTKRVIPKIDSVLFKKVTASSNGITPCSNLSMPFGIDSGTQSATFNLANLRDLELSDDNKRNWTCNGNSPLDIVRSWLNPIKTKNGKGFIFFWDSTSDVSRFVILEDQKPNEQDSSNECVKSLGTYIVNGGKDTPVISFDPDINFTFAVAAKSGAGTDTQTTQALHNRPSSNNPSNNPVNTGDTTFITMNEEINRYYGPGRLRVVIDSISANERANRYETLTARMTIQGDPTLDNPFTLKDRTVSVVVINPFHLNSNILRNNSVSRSDCPEWLVGPPCNRILSNKNYWIRNVTHEIREGNYTTMLELSLVKPGDNKGNAP